jgi:pyruvate kinase
MLLNKKMKKLPKIMGATGSIFLKYKLSPIESSGDAGVMDTSRCSIDNTDKYSAFSLIELSIILVIVGLILTGGVSLTKTAQLRTVVAKSETNRTVFNTCHSQSVDIPSTISSANAQTTVKNNNIVKKTHNSGAITSKFKRFVAGVKDNVPIGRRAKTKNLNMKMTKIVATIGPNSESPEILKKLSDAGVNVFRLNFSHGTYKDHGEKIDRIRALNLPGAIMLDTKGPEIRTGEVKDKLFVKIGDKFTMTIDKGIYEETGKISVNYRDFINDVSVGDVIVFDSGVMLAKALKKTNNKDIEFEVIEGETNITTKRHINLLGKPVSLPTITEQDWKDIDFGIEKNVDMIALSFVRSAKDVKAVKEYCAAKGKKDIFIISKIENFESTQNLEEIIAESDGVMVARGDLACEIPFSQVPIVQKRIIALASYFKKPVIVATQMLLSMVNSIQPTRAEVSDVANAVFEGADAVMTSDETTKGIDPVNVIKVMSKIAKDIEKEIYGCGCGCNENKDEGKTAKDTDHRSKNSNSSDNYCQCVSDIDCECDGDKSEIISILSNYTKDANAIVVISNNNLNYLKNISSARLNIPIFFFTNNKVLKNNSHLIWNTTPILENISNDWKKNLELVEKVIKDNCKNKNTKKYIFVFEIDGVLTIQVRELLK